MDPIRLYIIHTRGPLQLAGSVSEQLSSAAKAETVGVEVTVLRGQALSKKLSATLQVMAADL